MPCSRGVPPLVRFLFQCSWQAIEPHSEPNVQIHALDPPFPLAEQAPKPLDAEARPLGLLARNLIGSDTGQGACRRVERLDRSAVEDGVADGVDGGGGGDGGTRAVGGVMRVYPGLECGRRDPRGEPVAAELEEAAVGPVARCDEEDEQEDGAVHARPVQEVRAHEE